MHKGGGITVRNKDRWQMFLFLIDDWWFGHKVLRPVIQTLNNTPFSLLRVVQIICQVLTSVSWFSVDAGGKAVFRFFGNWRVKKGDLTLFLGFYGKADGGWLLRWCKKLSTYTTIKDGEGVISLALPGQQVLASCGLQGRGRSPTSVARLVQQLQLEH